MRDSTVEIRPITRKGYCRSCGRWLEVGEEIVHIPDYDKAVIICMDCSDDIVRLMTNRDIKLDKQI